MLLRGNIKSTITFLLGIVLGAAITIPAIAINMPHMTTARANLWAARTQLNEAVADKGGHRDNAIGLINQAITQVNQGIAYCNAHC